MSDRKKSRYAEKRDRGNQMYGPGCCGHKITMAQIEKCKAEARERRHFLWTPGLEADRAFRQRFWDKQKQNAA